MPADDIRPSTPPAAEQPDLQPVDTEMDEDWDDDAEDADRGTRTVRAVVAGVVLVIVVVLVLLLLRACSTTQTAASVGDKTIVAVPAQVRVENVLSLWVDNGVPVKQVLATADVRATSTRSMGGGLYFVFLADGVDADAAVARLKVDRRVHDAGFVYDQATPAASTGK